MLIDTHAHLSMDPLYVRWREVVAESIACGVGAMVVPGTDVLTSSRAIELAEDEPRIVASVGIHPENINEELEQITSLVSHPKVSAIGEIGLDYFRFPAKADQEKLIESQRVLFRSQLQLAQEHNLPVLVHLRTEQAMRDAVIDIETVYGKKEFRGIFHCFTGSLTFYNEIADWDVYVGVGGMITYGKQEQLRQVIAKIPLEKLVLETDSPFLTPEPLPKGTNIPGNVTITACKLAEIKSVPLMDILEITGKNALRLWPQLNQL